MHMVRYNSQLKQSMCWGKKQLRSFHLSLVLVLESKHGFYFLMKVEQRKDFGTRSKAKCSLGFMFLFIFRWNEKLRGTRSKTKCSLAPTLTSLARGFLHYYSLAGNVEAIVDPSFT